MPYGKFQAIEPGFGLEINQVGTLVAMEVKTPFGTKRVHFSATDARLMADGMGYAAIDAATAVQAAARRAMENLKAMGK